MHDPGADSNLCPVKNGTPPLDLRQLRYFVAIVDARSFSRAAERVHVAQSALSLQMRKLEDALGVELLIREPHGVRPTTAGLKLLDHARVILDQLSLAERDVRNERRQPGGPVTIGIPSGTGRALNAPLLTAVREEHPEVSLRIVEVLPSLVDAWLESGLIQLAVRYQLEDLDESADLLAREEYFLVSGAAESELGESVGLRDLSRFSLVMPTCIHNPRQCVVTRMSEIGLELNVGNRVDSLSTILDLVCGGQAQSILTPAAFLPEWRAGKIFAYRLEPAISRMVVLAAGASGKGESAVEAVAVVVRRVAARLTADGEWPSRLPTAAHPLKAPSPADFKVASLDHRKLIGFRS